MTKFIELFDAVDIVSNATLGENRAIINRDRQNSVQYGGCRD